MAVYFAKHTFVSNHWTGDSTA